MPELSVCGYSSLPMALSTQLTRRMMNSEMPAMIRKMTAGVAYVRKLMMRTSPVLEKRPMAAVCSEYTDTRAHESESALLALMSGSSSLRHLWRLMMAKEEKQFALFPTVIMISLRAMFR